MLWTQPPQNPSRGGGALSAEDLYWLYCTCLYVSWHKQCALMATQTDWKQCGCKAACASPCGTCMLMSPSLACRALLQDGGLLEQHGLWASVASATWASLLSHGVSHILPAWYSQHTPYCQGGCRPRKVGKDSDVILGAHQSHTHDKGSQQVVP